MWTKVNHYDNQATSIFFFFFFGIAVIVRGHPCFFFDDIYLPSLLQKPDSPHSLNVFFLPQTRHGRSHVEFSIFFFKSIGPRSIRIAGTAIWNWLWRHFFPPQAVPNTYLGSRWGHKSHRCYEVGRVSLVLIVTFCKDFIFNINLRLRNKIESERNCRFRRVKIPIDKLSYINS